MKNLLIWGAGGHGRVILDIARAMGTFGRIAFYDDSEGVAGKLEVEVISGGFREASRLGFAAFVVAIGPNSIRSQRFEEALATGMEAAVCVHPTAWISSGAVIEKGTVVMPRVVVQTGARVGANCILNTGTIVEHDCVIGDHVHLSPGVTLCGNVTVGPLAHLGAGVTVIPGGSIGSGAVVGAGAVVLGEVPGGVTAVGVPARVINRLTDD